MRMKTQVGALGAFVVALSLLQAVPAEAGFGIAGSLGTGILHKSGDWSRTSVDIEIMPHYKLGPLYFDLGIQFGMESPRNVRLRPGVRLHLLFLLFRAAVPIQLNNTSTAGYLFGLGTMIKLGPVGVFGEVDFTGLGGDIGLDAFALEFRAGVQFSF